MFCEVELVRIVIVLPKNLDRLDRNEQVLQRFIITRMLDDLQSEKASKDHGYFLAVTSLKRIGKAKVVDAESGAMFFRVAFNCRTFLPVKGDILQGVVYHIVSHGVFLRCGPTKSVFLSARKMPNYHYVPGENPVFLNDELVKIEMDVVVSFLVLAVRWEEIRKKEFSILASIEGESLGPILLSGSDELDL